jgi:protein O-mannosyl-transferase
VPRPARQSRRRRTVPQQTSHVGRWWPVALIVLAGIATYGNTFANPFIFDDFGSIVRNPQIRDLANLRAVFSPLADTAVANRPLVNLSFAINYAIGGLDVAGYHFVNLSLHLACALVLFGLVRRTLDIAGVANAGRATAIAGAIALLWVVHPLNSEVVDYLSERSESMMALCYLFVLYAGVRAYRSTHPGRWQIAAVTACAAGMACKESMVTAPLMLVLFDRVFLFGSMRDAVRARWRLYGAVALSWMLLLPSFLARSAISSGGFSSAEATPWTYLLNQAELVTRYFRLAFWPSSLVNYYGWARPLTLPDVWPFALFLLVALACAIVLFAKQPRLGFAALWVLVTLAPASSVIAIAAEVGAERRMYVPLAGLVALVVIAADRLLQKRTLPVVLFVAVVLAGVTFARNREYASALTMAQTVLERWPTPAAHHLVGAELSFAGRRDEAIAELRIAAPDYPPSRFYLGKALVDAGRRDDAIEAIDVLQRFLRDEPTSPVVPTVHMLLARAFWATQQWPQAIEQCELVLATRPDDPNAHALLADAWSSHGLSLISAGHVAAATDAFGKAVSASPRDGRLRQNFARALLDTGHVTEAAEQAQQAVALAPAEPGGHDVRARVFVAQGKLAEARREFERALQIDPAYAPSQEGLRALRGR